MRSGMSRADNMPEGDRKHHQVHFRKVNKRECDPLYSRCAHGIMPASSVR